MRSNRKLCYASYPDIDVIELRATLVHEHEELGCGRLFNDPQREACYDSFFDFWYHHWPDEVNGKPVHFRTWFESEFWGNL